MTDYDPTSAREWPDGCTEAKCQTCGLNYDFTIAQALAHTNARTPTREHTFRTKQGNKYKLTPGELVQ